MISKLNAFFYNSVLSETKKNKVERFILIVAILSFLAHLITIYLVQNQFIMIPAEVNFFDSPIAAIYTPFSFILIYEVYLLIFYLPRSITTYIGKQYEIITLIVIRRIFKDLANLELNSDWFDIKNDLNFTYDIITALLLFFMIYLFSLERQKLQVSNSVKALGPAQIEQFIAIKKFMATILVPVFVGIGLITFGSWVFQNSPENLSIALKDVNSIFFDEFFAILIIVDVFLLLFSFFYTDQFHKVIRNSGFIISTILIRLSFSVDGLLNNCLIISSIAFGLFILWIHNRFEKNIKPV
ncbi:MAG: hypothetical protein P8M66_03915 [Flavobacteriaceae bacterium]|jgi:hypothetical protein|nr:hypothetical protein [Formosa sp.]MDG1375280.1 hypothetical protein [Flavobacteriaceae bacterium]MDG2498639.1 hypothetical protein [Flavobacteriaceae bacterium]